MRIAKLVVLGIGAALLAPRLAVVPAQSLTVESREILARFVGPESPEGRACAVTWALPQELTGLIPPQDGCGTGIVSMPSPLSLVDISAQAMGHVWQTTAINPKVRIERIVHTARAWRAAVRDGLEAMTGIERGAVSVQVEQALETR